MKAYVLIKTAPGKDRSIVQTLRGSKAISSADVVTGPYDVIPPVEVPDSDTISDILMDDIRYVEGVIDTVMCFTVQVS
jgi:DNA-binding Lrp family transcriptional regulator